MIQKVEMYQAVCERCGRKHGYEFSEGMARYMAKMCDWEEIDAAYSMLCWCIENKFVKTNKNE